jgi:hypothetical protein
MIIRPLFLSFTLTIVSYGGFAADNTTVAGICDNCTRSQYSGFSNNMQDATDVQKQLSKPICPIKRIEAEIESVKQKNGLKVVFGDEANWNEMRCSTTQEVWNNSSISGFYCRESNVIVLRRNDPDILTTKFHEFQHYKNNSQIPLKNNQHPFNAIDFYFDQINNNTISKSDLDKALQIVLIILWDETQGFQMDIACSTNADIEINDQFIIDNFQISYVPRFAGLHFSKEQIAAIYWSAKRNAQLLDFQNDPTIISILHELNLQNQSLSLDETYNHQK